MRPVGPLPGGRVFRVARASTTRRAGAPRLRRGFWRAARSSARMAASIARVHHYPPSMSILPPPQLWAMLLSLSQKGCLLESRNASHGLGARHAERQIDSDGVKSSMQLSDDLVGSAPHLCLTFHVLCSCLSFFLFHAHTHTHTRTYLRTRSSAHRRGGMTLCVCFARDLHQRATSSVATIPHGSLGARCAVKRKIYMSVATIMH